MEYPLPPGHFSGGARLVTQDDDGLEKIVNDLAKQAALNAISASDAASAAAAITAFDLNMLVASPAGGWPYDVWNTLWLREMQLNEQLTVMGNVAVHVFAAQPQSTLVTSMHGSAFRAGTGFVQIDGTPFFGDSGTLRQGEFRMAAFGSSFALQFRHRTLPVGTAVSGNARLVFTVHTNQL